MRVEAHAGAFHFALDLGGFYRATADDARTAGPRWDFDTLPTMEPKRPSDSWEWICRFNGLFHGDLAASPGLDMPRYTGVSTLGNARQTERPGCRRVKATLAS
jgi:hypothetical protein